MRLNYILSALSIVLTGFGLMIFLPSFVAIYYHEYSSIFPFILSGFISLIIAFLFYKIAGGKQNFNDLRKKEGLFIVTLTWIMLSIVTSIPFLFSGLTPIDAILEGVASITTTGATLIDGITFSKTLYFWCSFSEWLGGMGVIVLFIAILPQFAVAGRQMFSAEVPGPPEDKITPRIKQTAIALWGIYFVLTVLGVLALKYSGMPWFDSICNSLATVSASGFSYNPISDVGILNSKILWTGAVFMFLSGVNFTLQYKLYVQRHLKALKNSEFMMYLFIILIVTLFSFLTLTFLNGYDINIAIRNAFYQVVSIVTSTGATLIDFEHWSKSTQILVFLLMLIGGSAGSASGGIKVVRVIIIFKYLWREIAKILHPQAVLQIKLGKSVVTDEILRQIITFVILYFLVLIGSSLLVCAIENDLTLGIMGSVSTLGNINPVFSYGDYGNISNLSSFTKLIFVFNMLVGRLEIIPFIAMLHTDFWQFNFKRSSNE